MVQAAHHNTLEEIEKQKCSAEDQRTKHLALILLRDIKFVI
jgi:hypothetical protein